MPWRRILLMVLLTLPVSLGPLHADEVHVLVLPFQMNMEKVPPGWQTRIAQVIADEFKGQGATVAVQPGAATDANAVFQARSLAQIRQAAKTGGAEFAVWGSLTAVAERFSIDFHLLKISGTAPPSVFYADAEGPSALFDAVKRLARKASMAIFSRPLVAAVRVEGNHRIESDAILRVVTTKAGSVYNKAELSSDLKKIWAMGYFDDVRVDANDSNQGEIVTFHVIETPTIRKIRFEGNNVFTEKELLQNMTIKTGSVFNETVIANNIQALKTAYQGKNYHNVRIRYTTKTLPTQQVDLTFRIEEGKKLKIQHINFEGNSHFTAKELRDMMDTSVEGWFSWLTSSGDLDPRKLDQDVSKIAAAYRNSGYIMAKVADPVIQYTKNGIDITIKIQEGPRYRVGKVDVTGDPDIPKARLMSMIKIAGKKYFDQEVVRDDVFALKDFYSDRGFAFADVIPDVKEHPKTLRVDITYRIRKGGEVYFQKIVISGNTKTRDKVIRRELQVYERELFSGKRLKRSIRNLHMLDYFDDVKVETPKGSDDHHMVLDINVKEKATGKFMFGAGYSTVDKVYGTFGISQRNLFGRGETIALQSLIGAAENRWDLSFTEPWLFDIPLSSTVHVYNWKYDYDLYSKDSTGGGFIFSYPIGDYSRASFGYTFDESDITNINASAPDTIKDIAGLNTTSSVTLGLSYDSRDRVFNPSTGVVSGITYEFAGLGGNVGFSQVVAKVGEYFPLRWGCIGFLHAEAGYMSPVLGLTLPDYDKFFLGGINSMRGFTWEQMAPEVLDSQGVLEPVGGTKYVQFNAESTFPISEKEGLVGVVFVDTGAVYGDNEDIDLGSLREDAGLGLRWYSPMGPIRLEYGQILDPISGRGTGGQWNFSFGAAF